MHRRRALQLFTQTAAAWAAAGLPCRGEEPKPRTGLGLVSYCRSLWQRHRGGTGVGLDLSTPPAFLRHCAELGAGGAQVSLGVLTAEQAAEVRNLCESLGMFLEAGIGLPRTPADLERFRAEMQSAREAGARAVRCVMIPGRRYEEYKSLEDFRRAEAAGRAMLERAVPIAAQLRLPLAVENHKDHRNGERLRLLEAFSSEWLGACIDTGNSVALLEEAVETVRALAPWAHAVHLKDQAVQPDAEGFLLADIPLGQGCLNLAEMVRVLREAKPGLPMCLELITRDPLKVPCLAESYWPTFPDVPAVDLARTLRMVHSSAAAELATVSSREPAEQVALETQNIVASLRYAREQLRL